MSFRNNNKKTIHYDFYNILVHSSAIQNRVNISVNTICIYPYSFLDRFLILSRCMAHPLLLKLIIVPIHDVTNSLFLYLRNYYCYIKHTHSSIYKKWSSVLLPWRQWSYEHLKQWIPEVVHFIFIQPKSINSIFLLIFHFLFCHLYLCLFQLHWILIIYSTQMLQMSSAYIFFVFLKKFKWLFPVWDRLFPNICNNVEYWCN